MSGDGKIRDLIMLVADKNMEFAVKGLLTRSQSLGIREPDAQIFVDPHHDPGCYGKAHEFLRPFANKFSHALVLFDHDGCGHRDRSPFEIEKGMNERLADNGWGERAGTVVINPELEIWVWSDSSEVDRILGWSDRLPALRDWLRENDLWREVDLKPTDPKRAMEAALKAVNKPRSSSVFYELACKVGIRRCTDSRFQILRDYLVNWFSQSSASASA